MIRSIVFLFGLAFMIGCGAQNNPTKEGGGSTSDTVGATDESPVQGVDEVPAVEEISPVTTDETEGNTIEESILPETISIEIPSVLKQSAPKETNQTADTNQSITNDLGYEQLKEDIAKVEDVVKIAQINLIFLEKVMPKVQERCEGMVSCLFEEKHLSVVMDNRTINSLNTLTGETNLTSFEVNDTVQLGQIGFTKYDINRSYQYELTLNMLLSDMKKTTHILNEYQSFKWSEDDSDVITNYVYEDNETLTDVSLHYLTDEEGKEVMHVYDTSSDKTAKMKENTSLILVTDEEHNNSFNLTSNSIFKSEDNESNTSGFSSNVQISDEGSLLLFSGSVSEETLGTALGATSELVCDNNLSCNPSDEDNVSQDTIDEGTTLYELRITGGNLAEGDYILLAPDTNLEALSLIDIFESSLGSITVLDGKAQGALHSDAFLYMLNSLTIVMIDKTHESTEMFKSVEKEDYPTLRIVKY